QWCPVWYVLFDLLYHAGRCLMHEPLVRRRGVLAEVCERLDAEAVLFSPAMIGAGTALYQAVVAEGQEGVMAKQLLSVYRPGKRSAAWKKIQTMIVARIGYRGIALTPGSNYFALLRARLPARNTKNAPMVYNVQPYSCSHGLFVQRSRNSRQEA